MQDIESFNSMINAANKQIKNLFLYHQYIPGATALPIYLQMAIDDPKIHLPVFSNGFVKVE